MSDSRECMSDLSQHLVLDADGKQTPMHAIVMDS